MPQGSTVHCLWPQLLSRHVLRIVTRGAQACENKWG